MVQVVKGRIRCPHCQAEITTRELKTLWSEYCNRRRHSAPTVPAPVRTAPAGAKQTLDSRASLIEWLTEWRGEHGIRDPQRSMANRSTAQLHRMYRQIQIEM